MGLLGVDRPELTTNGTDKGKDKKGSSGNSPKRNLGPCQHSRGDVVDGPTDLLFFCLVSTFTGPGDPHPGETTKIRRGISDYRETGLGLDGESRKHTSVRVCREEGVCVYM